jgi:hypothetical protein
MADKRISQLIERTDIANNDVLPIVASGATTTNKVTISTIQDWMQENLDVGVTSVGLSMPSAFTVSNSPVTTSGNISVTGAGTTAQYIRGDGSLADFPSSTGGGSSVSYYLNGSVNQGTIGGIAYRELSKSPILGAGTDFTINADGYIASFITDAGDPNLLLIPAGNWNFETYLQASSGGGTPTFYIELYKVNSGGTATLIASNSGSPELIAFGTNINPYFSALAVPETTLLLTDRLAIRYYVAHSGRTITLHTENNTLCQIITTFTTGLTALNGLTAQVQNFATGTSGTDFNISSASTTHTFNIPSASGTARGLITTGSQTIAGEKTFTSLLTASGANINTPSNGISVLLNGRTSDNFSSIRFGANTGAGQYNSIGANSSSFDISSLGNTPITFSTNTQGGGGIRMTIAGSGGVTFTNGITTTSAVLTSVLQGVNANFSGLIETTDSVRIGTTASVKHSNTGFTLSGYNNIHGNIDGFVVQNQTKGFRINFPSNAGFTHTLPDASGTIALTSNLSAYLPLTGGTLTGALNGTTASFTGAVSVKGGITIVRSNTSESSIITNEGNLIYNARDSFNHVFQSNGTEIARINTLGAATFSSSVTANARSFIRGSAGYLFDIEEQGSNKSRFQSYVVSNEVSLIAGYDTTSVPMTFYTGNSERMRITSGGNVGIGTPTASAKVHIKQSNSNWYDGIRVFDGSSNSWIGIGNTGSAAVLASSYDNTGSYLPLAFYTSDTEKMRITSDGYLRMASGTGGIQFNGDTAAANALDDYEEGTWTMGISFGGASVGVTYVLNTGRYTKVGRQVTATGFISLSSKGSSTGDARVTGLPFAIGNDIGNYSAPSFGYINKITFADQLSAYGEISTTQFLFEETTNAGVKTTITNSDFANDSEIMVSFTYFV